MLEFTVEKILTGLLEVALSDLPGKLAEADFHGLVIDSVYMFAQLVPLEYGSPIRADLEYSPSSVWRPPFFAGWPHDTTPETLARNVEGMKRYGGFLEPMVPIAQAYAGKVGLEIDWADLGAADQPSRDLADARGLRLPGHPGPPGSTTRARSTTAEAGSRCRSSGISWTAGRSSMPRWGHSSTIEFHP